MNVDEILQNMNREEVDYLLIGGMNFLFRHTPDLTFDVDLWVNDTRENLERVNRALRRLGAEWGKTEENWGPVPDDARWLEAQGCFCLTTRFGALDIFREVRGLERRFGECTDTAIAGRTANGTMFKGLSDQHMLECQLALPEGLRNLKRIAILQRALEKAD